VAVGLNGGHGSSWVFCTGREIPTHHGFGQVGQILLAELLGGNLREIAEGGAAGLARRALIDAFAGEGPDGGHRVGVAGDGVADHGVDATKPVPLGISTSPKTLPGGQRMWVSFPRRPEVMAIWSMMPQGAPTTWFSAIWARRAMRVGSSLRPR